jgi:hypothetical protein
MEFPEGFCADDGNAPDFDTDTVESSVSSKRSRKEKKNNSGSPTLQMFSMEIGSIKDMFVSETESVGTKTTSEI